MASKPPLNQPLKPFKNPPKNLSHNEDYVKLAYFDHSKNIKRLSKTNY
jgi:hypothetical protein